MLEWALSFCLDYPAISVSVNHRNALCKVVLCLCIIQFPVPCNTYYKMNTTWRVVVLYYLRKNNKSHMCLLQGMFYWNIFNLCLVESMDLWTQTTHCSVFFINWCRTAQPTVDSTIPGQVTLGLNLAKYKPENKSVSESGKQLSSMICCFKPLLEFLSWHPSMMNSDLEV